MAAHILTAINQQLERPNNGQVRAALNYSCWTDDLTLSEYSQLDDIVNAYDLTEKEKDAFMTHFLSGIVTKYHNLWVELGQPETREAWHKAIYGK